MKPVLIDTNVILDIATEDPEWFAWSNAALARESEKSVLIINAIIYAEVSADYDTIAQVDHILPPLVFHREPIPYEAAFLAGKAFKIYRRRGGARTSPLPDFFIGAHAAISGYRLLTRDPNRYRDYFPTVPLIAPR